MSCHSNQSSYPIGTKTQLFVPPAYKCYMGRIGFTASEEKSFENGDGRMDGRTTDARLYYKLTYELFGSGELKRQWSRTDTIEFHILP